MKPKLKKKSDKRGRWAREPWLTITGSKNTMKIKLFLLLLQIIFIVGAVSNYIWTGLHFGVW